MNITSAQKRFWESPTDYIGKLPTTGKGVGVVVMDEGFDLSHPDLKGRVDEVYLTPNDRFDSDPVGHGTLVAGIINGNGSASDGEIKGVAPEAKLYAMKVNLDPKAGWEASSASVSAGIRWAVQNRDELNIKVINCSFVLPMVETLDPQTMQPNGLYDPLDDALKLAYEAGITVVAGTGNFADKMPIMTPAGNPKVIAVGALDTNGTPQDLSDDTVATFSSRGKSSLGEDKPDILAPGVNILSTNAANSSFEQLNVKNTKFAMAALRGPLNVVEKLAQAQVAKGWLPTSVLGLPEQQLREQVLRCYEVKATQGDNDGHPAYIAQNGTSEASPVVAGVEANMYQADPALTPDEVKEILFSTAHPVAGARLAQGHGAINAQAAIMEAMSRRSRRVAG